MPKLRCTCSEVLNYGEIPCPIEWLTISDVEFDGLSKPCDLEVLYQRMTSLLQCPDCGRLWVFWEGFGKPPTEYVPQKE
ncbi:MAG: hypothetical protein CO108_26270 [Deltaproteobacteria bacterium CG_4_9_14_3_um_filter_63_12]|nr:MAG: hypothetical protein CO108_26270 [Deltaproteobacteria bacterium CG_4_9_14_3_um_filter_63_12]